MAEVAPPEPAQSAFVSVLVATVMLHKLYCAGENDSMEADRVRNGASYAWDRLTPAEQQVAREFSAALAELE